MERYLRIIVAFLLLSHRALSQQGSSDPVGKFHLINAYGLCLASEANWGHNGNNLVQWECLPERGQRWSFDNPSLGSGDRHICNDFKKCIKDVPGEARLVQFDPFDGDVQQFTLVPSNLKGYWYIKNDDGHCLSGDPKNGSLVTLSTCTPYLPAQMWKRFRMNPEGSFSMPTVNPINSPTLIPPGMPTVFQSFNPPLFPTALQTPIFPSAALPETIITKEPTPLLTHTPTLTVSPTSTVLSTWIPSWASSTVKPIQPTSTPSTVESFSTTTIEPPTSVTKPTISSILTAETAPTTEPSSTSSIELVVSNIPTVTEVIESIPAGSTSTGIPSPSDTASPTGTVSSTSVALTTESPASVKPTTVLPTEELPPLITPPLPEQESVNRPNATNTIPPVLFLFGPVDLDGKPVFWPLNLLPIKNDINISTFPLNRTAPLPEKYIKIDGSMNYPFPK